MSKKRNTKSKRPVIAVSSGQTFRVPRTGKPTMRVRISRVLTGDRRQPKVTYQVVSRSGKPTKRTWFVTKEHGKPKRKELKRVRWLQWREGAWHLPVTWITDA